MILSASVLSGTVFTVTHNDCFEYSPTMCYVRCVAKYLLMSCHWSVVRLWISGSNRPQQKHLG